MWGVGSRRRLRRDCIVTSRQKLAVWTPDLVTSRKLIASRHGGARRGTPVETEQPSLPGHFDCGPKFLVRQAAMANFITGILASDARAHKIPGSYTAEQDGYRS